MSADSFDLRVQALLARANSLEKDGIPFPTRKIRVGIENAKASGDTIRARAIVERASLLLDQTQNRWNPVREQLHRAEQLRGLAEQVGLETGPYDGGIAAVRADVRSGPLSNALFDQASTKVQRSIADLEKAIPQHSSVEARKFSERLQAAKRRGEDVSEASAEFDHLLDALRRRDVFEISTRLPELKRALGRIPIEPAVAFPTNDEEEEILLEARILARRLQRIKVNARDARSAARLMTHVRAALSEDRRYGTSQEEIEQLWEEVGRLTKDRETGETPPTRPAEPVAVPEEPFETPPAKPNALPSAYLPAGLGGPPGAVARDARRRASMRNA